MAETRRRGEALESAILVAAWDDLVERGYSGMTYDAVAERARTSKPVLYRRWPTKEALMLAAIKHRGILTPLPTADTGSLRNDVIEMLHTFNQRADSIAGLFSSVLSSYFAETGISPADMRRMVFGEGRSGMDRVIARAVERGDLPSAVLPPRVRSLPSDLARQELLMTLRPMPDDVILDIVDVVFIPLLRSYVPDARV